MATRGTSTDLETLQRRVDESVGTIKRLFDAASDCMALVRGQDGKFLAANPAFESLTGYLFGELQFMHLWELWRPDMADEASHAFRQILETGSGSGTEVPLLKKDGSIITAEFAARAMRYQGQDALLSIMVDITDRKTSQRRDARLGSVQAALEDIRAAATAAGETAGSLSEQASSLQDHLLSDPEWNGRLAAWRESVESLANALTEIRQRAESALQPPQE